MSIEPPAASPAASGDPLPPNHRISAPLVAALRERYEIVRETGRGASAIVYLARDLKHERLVALKTLSPDVGEVAGERFLREIQVAAGMQHPHILPMYDSGVADGRLYFVMPFVDGGSLRQRLDAEPQLPIEDALKCAHDIALALAFAHDQGVVHRDIKPENILFYHGHACLADFGVARVMQEIDVRVTGHGMVVGTPAYMSPEQLTDGGFDGRSDVYSLACVLYEMLAGVHAFSGSTPKELLEKRLLTTPEPLHRHRPEVPQFVEDLLVRALAAAPMSRFPDARAFADAIEFAQRDLITPHRVSGPRRAIESVPRHPLAWAGSLMAIVALGALAATPLRTVVRNRAANGGRGAYDAGMAALAKWELPEAERQFAAAAVANPVNAAAQLGLAHTLELERRVDSDQFRLAVARLAPLRAAFHGRDSLLAEAMMAFAARAYPKACDAFERMRARDSLDAGAWFGLGDCLSLDSLVVPDPRSASGLRFRTGWHSAARAYMRAATIEPLAHRGLSFVLLSTLLPTNPVRVRIGRAEGTPATIYAAHPSLAGDTVAYVPFALSEIAAGTSRALSASFADALDRNRDALVGFGRAWVAAQPDNPDAFEALSAGLEARGEIGVDAEAAGGALRQARSLAADSSHRIRLAAIDVRLHLKRGDFRGARAIADSVLASAAAAAPSPVDADWLVGLAALTGRTERAAALRSRASVTGVNGSDVPAQVSGPANRLFMRAALGVCDDTLKALTRSIDGLLDSYAEPARREAMRQAVLSRAMTLAYPCMGNAPLASLRPSLAIERAQRAAPANPRRALAILDSAAIPRRGMRPGDVALDFTVQEAWLRAAVGDTTGALRQLDLVLNALPTLGPFATHEEAQSAAVGRALLLRAELAAAMHDVTQQRQRAGEALALWEHADSSLSPTLARLRSLAAVK